MAGIVLDASALIAMLKGERGGDKVTAIIAQAAIGLVNYSEVVTHYVRQGSGLADINAMLRPLPIKILDVDRDIAVDAGALAAITQQYGLSLGDRFCLALARRHRLPAWTADRDWSQVADQVGVEVRLVR